MSTFSHSEAYGIINWMCTIGVASLLEILKSMWGRFRVA